MNVYLLGLTGIGSHWWKGSPSYPRLHVQIGLWLMTAHCALMPQDPGHGFLHFWLIQARSREHSDDMMHSGLQPEAGLPKNPGTQVHTGRPSTASQREFGPHGLRSHGSSLGSTGSSGSTKK